MLKTMRDSFHQLKWTLFAVIIVFILGFVFFSGSNAGGSRNRGEELARVGDESVTASDFDRIYQAEQLDRVEVGEAPGARAHGAHLPRRRR